MTLRRPITNQKTIIMDDIDKKKDSNTTRWTFIITVELISIATLFLSLIVLCVTFASKLFDLAILFFLILIGATILVGISLPRSEKYRKKDKVLHDAEWIMKYWVENQQLSPLFYKHYNDQFDNALSFLMYNYEISLYTSKVKA